MPASLMYFCSGTPMQFYSGVDRWKPGLKNRAAPAYNEAVLVREILAAPIFDTCEASSCAGSPYFGEPLTLVLALLGHYGDFVELRYDGRRFEPVDP